MICYVLAIGKHVVVGYGTKIFWPGLHYVTRSPARDDGNDRGMRGEGRGGRD